MTHEPLQSSMKLALYLHFIYFCLFLATLQKDNDRVVTFYPIGMDDDYYAMWLPIGKSKEDCMLPVQFSRSVTEICQDYCGQHRPTSSSCVDRCVVRPIDDCQFYFWIPDDCFEGNPFSNSTAKIVFSEDQFLYCKGTEFVQPKGNEIKVWEAHSVILITTQVFWYLATLAILNLQRDDIRRWAIFGFLFSSPSLLLTYQAPGVYRFPNHIYPAWFNKTWIFFNLFALLLITFLCSYPFHTAALALSYPMVLYFNARHIRLSHFSDVRFYMSLFGYSLVMLLVIVALKLLRMSLREYHHPPLDDSDNESPEAEQV